MIDQARHARWMKLDLICLPGNKKHIIFHQQKVLWNTSNKQFFKQVMSGWGGGGQATVTMQQLSSPSDWGWLKQNNVWIPNWTELHAIAECCQELQKCGCKRSSCTGNCKCYRSGLAQYLILATVKKMTNCSLCIFFASVRTLFVMCLLS